MRFFNDILKINERTRNLAVWLVILMGLFYQTELNATHIVGGNMYYTCLGNDMYEITMIIRRDCRFGADDAPHDGPQVYLTIFDGLGQFFPRRGDNGFVKLDLLGIDTLNTSLEDFCIDGGDTVCVSQATYRGMVCLPREESGYIISYQRCCRNASLTNIIEPLETGGTWQVEIFDNAQAACNSNPVFNSWPPVYVCLNDDLVYDHSATDPDGDSLVYKLCTPYQGATRSEPAPGKSANPPFDSVVWRAPYSLGDMMGGTPLEIDPSTGLITARPDAIGQYLIGVVVEEYRNGVLIGRNKRDFEFNVRACGEKPEADFEVLSDKCDGLKQTFQNNSEGAVKYTWYFDYPNLQPSSMEENPMHTYDSVGKYTVVLIAESAEGCTDSISKMIEVLNPMLMPDFDLDVECADTFKVTLINLSTSKDPIVLYEWKVTDPNGEVYTSNEENPMFFFDVPGTYKVWLKITDINDCMEFIEKSFELEDVELEFIQDSFEICRGEEIRILQNGNSDWTYKWTPMDSSLKLDPPHDPKVCPDSSMTYCVTVTNGVCSDSGCVYVEVIDTIAVDIMGPDSTCTGDVMLMALADSSVTIEWALNDEFNLVIGTEDKLNYTISSTTTFYVRAGGDQPCPGIDSHTVVFFDPVDEDIPDRHVICFGPGMIQLNPGGNEDYEYRWSPGEVLDDSTLADPKAMIDTTTKFTVIIVNPEYPECPDTQMVLVEVGIDFEIIGLPEDTLICDEDSLWLTVTTVPEDGLTIMWCDEDGRKIGSGDSVLVDPDTIECVIVKVSDLPECVKTDTMKIDFHDLDISIQAPDSICAGDTTMIMLINNNMDSLKIEWFPKDKIIGTNTGPVIKVAPDTTTTYTAVIMNLAGCMWERDITISVGGFDIPVIATADPTEIFPGEKTQLDVNIGGNVTYMWTGDGLTDSTIRDPMAMPMDTGEHTYIIKVTDEMGCMGIDSVTVTVLKPDCIEGVFIPNAFSPNGDGENDFLYVRSQVIQQMTLKIFNRWGEKVFESNDQSIPWDGTINGEALPPDVYGYLLEYRCIDGMDYMKKGNVTLFK